MKTIENNMADQHLTVKSLTVLGSLDSSGTREIRSTVEAVRQQIAMNVKKQDQYWTELSADGVITPVEKKNLAREFENIRRSYNAITAQATAYGLTDLVPLYVQSYNALVTYVTVTLGLFNDMTENTLVADIDVFNGYFADYYYNENFLLLSMSGAMPEKFWEEVSEDGIITPMEKQGLARDIANIKRSYSAITTQAATLGYSGSVLEDFTRTFNTLIAYIETTLNLFADMTESTEIQDRTAFNAYFSNYYYEESFINLAITSGILEHMEIKVLNSLEDEGEENQVALYRGAIYQYVNGEWQNVTTGAYKGPQNELPAAEENAFFIASDNFVINDVLWVNGEELYVNGEKFQVNVLFKKGVIYYNNGGNWYEETDRTNWRYAAAFADVINITGELPQIFQDAIDDLQAQVDTKASQTSLQDEIDARRDQYTLIAGDIVHIDGRIDGVISNAEAMQDELDTKINHLPVFFGASATDPANPLDGDFYVYSGISSATRLNSKIYRYKASTTSWEELDSADGANRSYYMTALETILALNNTTSGYFGEVFASSFFGNNATLNSLATKTIYLRQDGCIMSDKTQYVYHTSGLKMDADGDIDANGNTHIGGTCTIDGNTTIGGTCSIAGTATIGTKLASSLQSQNEVSNAINTATTGLASEQYVNDAVSDLAPASSVTDAKDALAQNMGYSNFADLAAKAAQGKTIVDGGHINTALITAEVINAVAAAFDFLDVNKHLKAETGTIGGIKINQSGMQSDNFEQPLLMIRYGTTSDDYSSEVYIEATDPTYNVKQGYIHISEDGGETWRHFSNGYRRGVSWAWTDSEDFPQSLNPLSTTNFPGNGESPVGKYLHLIQGSSGGSYDYSFKAKGDEGFRLLRNGKINIYEGEFRGAIKNGVMLCSEEEQSAEPITVIPSGTELHNGYSYENTNGDYKGYIFDKILVQISYSSLIGGYVSGLTLYLNNSQIYEENEINPNAVHIISEPIIYKSPATRGKTFKLFDLPTANVGKDIVYVQNGYLRIGT